MNHGGDETGYIPKALDAQERFLWWEMDQAVIAIMLISMGVIAGSMLTGMAMGANIQNSPLMRSIGGFPAACS
jgi:type IV conjugative transfer system protein TraL